MSIGIADPHTECPLAGALAERLRGSRDALTAHWLERISDRVSLPPGRIFPTEDLLDHVPFLITGIADYLENPAQEVSANTPVVGKAMELGEFRHEQGFDAYEILKEYEILGGIVFNYLAQAADEMPDPCEKSELLVCGQRLFKAIEIIQQTTTMQYLRAADSMVAERERRLRGFNRAVSHELKNDIGAILGATEIIGEIRGMAPEKRKEFDDIVARRARNMKSTIENLIALSLMDKDTRQHRHVQLPEAVAEATRQVRDTASEARVELIVAEQLPKIDVNAGGVELCLTNYLTNAIKYRDQTKPEHYARIGASVEEDADGKQQVVVRVYDNGLGVPTDKRESLFQLFFRAHDKTATTAEGTGLGLSIVRETAESMGGTAWAELDGPETVFAFSLLVRGDAPRS